MRILLLLALASTASAEEPTREQVAAALRKATTFMHGTVADHGGYPWRSSVDGKLREGEGVCPPGTVWVQPPGTPAVGMAFLDAYDATKDEVHLKAAVDAARALVKGQLLSGGWHYRMAFDSPDFQTRAGRVYTDATPFPGGWDVWKKRVRKGDVTVLDDDTTTAAIRFLMRMDETLAFKDEKIHKAVEYALKSLINAQYPIGAWSHNYDRFPTERPSEKHYPVKAASFPEKWSREWTKDFTGCYTINDRVTMNCIRTLLFAHRIYKDKTYLDAAERGGKFLVRAQLPEPQPAWAQQYDRNMHPVWDRKFEPPAITGMESQDVLDALLTLFVETLDDKYLEPFEPALRYLRSCELTGHKLARFYEIGTNKPLYFNRNYELTHSDADLPEHYASAFPSRVSSIEANYRHFKEKTFRRPLPVVRVVMSDALRKETRETMTAMSAGGAWLDPGSVRSPDGKKVTPKEGVVTSATFIENVRTLSSYYAALPKN